MRHLWPAAPWLALQAFPTNHAGYSMVGSLVTEGRCLPATWRESANHPLLPCPTVGNAWNEVCSLMEASLIKGVAALRGYYEPRRSRLSTGSSIHRP